VDGPPVSEIPDLPLLSRAFGGVALVVEANRTKRQAVGEAVRVLNAAAANLLGIIMTNREYFIPEWVYKRM
jgi:Mrp family chromosome partitioning ATPase